MSDVWQGPGWWLASDGKWYPADAEPGAVYEGDLQSSDDPGGDAPVQAAETDTPVDAAIPDLAIPDLAAPAPDAAIPDLAIPDLAMPDLDVPDVEASVEDLSSPVAAMPDPIVESAGGWQAIGEVPTPEPELDIETESASFEVLENHGETVEEDGWTSAFEERQVAGDVLDDTAPPVAAAAPPSIDIPDAEPIPDLATPVVDIPDAAVPDMAAPVEHASIDPAPIEPMPEVSVPEPAAPEVAQPEPRNAVATPIERQDAWRKPVTGESVRGDVITAPAPAPSRAPEVVDLAIPEDHQHEIIEPPKRGMKMWLGILAVIGLLILIAFLLASLFSGNSTTNTNDATTSTAVESVDETTTEAPTSTEAEAVAEPEVTEPADNNEATSTSEGEAASVFDLRAGDCIVGDIGAGQVTRVEKVDCEVPHQFEVYREALIESSITSFDEVAISAYAEDVCRTSLDAYVPDNTEQNLRFKFLQPTEDSWNQEEDPDRVVTCLLFNGDEQELIGRAR